MSSSSGISNGKKLDIAEVMMLRRFTSPTIANAMERLGVTLRQSVYTNASIRCLFPELGAVVGYACTATILSAQPASDPRRVWRTEYWEYTQQAPSPKLTVVQDLSEVPGGAYWGEVNANIHRALGSQGVITNGTVRDIEEVQRLGFHFFASGVQVSHGHAHLEDFNRPVKVFDILVHPGDLIHADRHGAVVIPEEIAERVAEAALQIEADEKPMISVCQSPGFSIAELDKLIPKAY
jgi:regulator of RNase E activity RraA